jgi:protein gp37
MKRWGKQADLHFESRELKTDLGNSNFIFVGSSCDMFADAVPEVWIAKTLAHCVSFDQNRYLFQSKNPARMLTIEHYFNDLFLNFDKAVVCTTLETNRHYPDVMRAAPSIVARVSAFRYLPFKRYVTIEPILDFDIEPFVELLKRCEPEQVNIGADSGNNGLPEPSREKVLALIAELQKFTIIHHKSNLRRLGIK